MSDAFAPLSERDRACLKPQVRPARTAPMLATLTDDPFSDDAWIYERERVPAFRETPEV